MNEISYFLRRHLYITNLMGHSLKMALWKKSKHVAAIFIKSSFNCTYITKDALDCKIIYVYIIY